MLLVRTALRLLAVVVVSSLLLWPTAANAKLRLESRQWTGAQPTSPASAKSLFDSLPVGGAGYGTADLVGIVSSGTSVSNSLPGGSNSNYGVHIAANFTVGASQVGPWTFEWGVDFAGGGVVFVDGVAIAENWTDDMWWEGNWATASGVLAGTTSLAAGVHRFELYGFEDCCDGAMGARFKIGGGAYKDLNETNLPSMSVDLPFGSPLAPGDTCVSTGTESQGTANTCQDRICDTSDSLCGVKSGVTCLSGATKGCRAGVCHTDNRCGLPNGTTCESAEQCRSGACGSDGKCGTPAGGSCTVAATCRANICSDGKCGSAPGGVCAVGSDCSSGYCGSDLKCGFTNSSPCTRDAQCRVLLCNSDGRCGSPGGASCTSNAVCRSAVCTASLCEEVVVSDAGVTVNDGGVSSVDGGTLASDASASATDSGSSTGGSTGTGTGSGGTDGGSGADAGGEGAGSPEEDSDGGGCSLHAGRGFGGAALLWAVSAGVLRARRRRQRLNP